MRDVAVPSPAGRRWREAPDEGGRIPTSGKLSVDRLVHALIRPSGTPPRREKGSKKVETPLDADEAEPPRYPQRAGSFQSAWRCAAMKTIRFRPSASRATIRLRHRCLVPLPQSFAEYPERRTGRFLLWDFRSGHDVVGHVLERESNPRHSDYQSDALPI